MTRTQLQIDDETYEALRVRAFSERRSMSAVVRELLRAGLRLEKTDRGDIRSEFPFIGSGSCDRTDISEKHDEAWAEDIL